MIFAALKYSDIVGLERSIDAAYQIASQRLFDVFFDKFKLLDHLLALKHYLMLGYGDFADHLMEALGFVLLNIEECCTNFVDLTSLAQPTHYIVTTLLPH